MQLFYNPNLSEESKEFTFDKDESRHILKVLRMEKRDTLTITDGKGRFFDAEITLTDPKRCTAKILETKQVAPLPYYLHMAVAPTKMNDRYEWFLEKATEIGVSEITPIICDHSERKVIKHERYGKIVQSAMKQSLKAHLPILNQAVSLKEFIASEETGDGIRCIAHCAETDKKSLKSVIQPHKKVTLLIGPEGDFSANEIALAHKKGFVPVSLGDTRLRTETAAIVACHSVAFINQNE